MGNDPINRKPGYSTKPLHSDRLLTPLLDNNLRLLRQYRPALLRSITPFLTLGFPGEIFMSTNGLANLRFINTGRQSIDLHPLQDPSSGGKEVARLLEGREGQIIFILGFGLGYEAIAACRKASCFNLIKIIDPDPIFFVQALKYNDLSELIVDGNVHLFIGATLKDLESIVAFADRWYLLHETPYLISLSNPGKINPEFYPQAQNLLYRLVNAQTLQSHTTLKYAKDMVTNAFQNISTMVRGLPYDTLAGLFKDLPCVIVSAGPSLKKNIHRLKDFNSKVIIIAVDSAVPTLLEQGIKPHFVVAMDHRHRNADTLWDLWESLSESALLFLNQSTPYIPKLFIGKNYYYAYDAAPVNVFFNNLLGGESQPVPNISSVAIFAFVLAEKLGCNPIILTGQDLSLAGNFDAAHIQKEQLVPVEDVFGNTIYTSHEFLAMIERFEKVLAESNKTIIDATEGGVKLARTLIVPLAEALEKFTESAIEIEDLPTNPDMMKTVTQAISYLGKTRTELEQLRNDCRQVVDKAEWAYHHLLANSRGSAGHPKREVVVSEKLARAVNYIRKTHDRIAGNIQGLQQCSHILDTIVAESRLECHREIIRWKKNHPELCKTPGVSKLLGELKQHRLQCAGLIDAAEWFLHKIEISRKRLNYVGEDIDCSHTPAGELLERGEIFLESLDFQAAHECFEQILSKDPKCAHAHYGLGKIHLYLKDSPEALFHFKLASEYEPLLAPQVDATLEEKSIEYLEAARDRIARKRKGAKRFLNYIIPGFPGYEEARKLQELADRP